jgi:hypothetical protein
MKKWSDETTAKDWNLPEAFGHVFVKVEIF